MRTDGAVRQARRVSISLKVRISGRSKFVIMAFTECANYFRHAGYVSI